MRPLFPATGYARLEPQAARIVLAVFLLGTSALVAMSLSPLRINMAEKNRGRGEGDLALYMAEVERIRRGEGYYEAAAAELAPRGYPTRSVFNWRTPLPMWLLGRLPVPELGRGLLILLAAAGLLLGFEALAREQGHGLGRPLLGGLLLTGPLLFCCLDRLYVSPVVWSGAFIAVSVASYGIDRRLLGVSFGLAALFFRELALPYCVMAAVLAWWESRKGEFRLWLAGLAAWGLFFLLHCLRVQPLIGPDAQSHDEGWLQFLGLPFVVATTQMNAFLLILPQWVTALYFSLGMLGVAGWHTPLGRRVGLSLCVYVVAFGIAGHDFNQYWGTLVAPLWCYAAAQAPGAIRDLIGGARLASGTAPQRKKLAAGH